MRPRHLPEKPSSSACEPPCWLSPLVPSNSSYSSPPSAYPPTPTPPRAKGYDSLYLYYIGSHVYYCDTPQSSHPPRRGYSNSPAHRAARCPLPPVHRQSPTPAV